MHPALQTLYDFAVTRPVAWGAPVAAALGVAFGGYFYIGPQVRDPMMPSIINPYGLQADTAVPIAWPGGKVPDYVIGTDFITMTRPAPPIYAPEPEPPPLEIDFSRPAAPPEPKAAPAPPRTYAAMGGDILDVRLPEDRSPPPEAVPVVAAEALPAR